MEIRIIPLELGCLRAFRGYLMPETVLALERRDPQILVLGAAVGDRACGAAAARIEGTAAELTDLFVDETIRGRKVAQHLLERLVMGLADRLVWTVRADYVLRGEQLEIMEHVLAREGFSGTQMRSRVFAAKSENFHGDAILGPAFRPDYRTPNEVLPFSELPEATLAELKNAPEIPENLTYDFCRDRMLPDLSVAYAARGVISAYLLAGASSDGGFLLLAAYTREHAPATAFLVLLKELANRCYYRCGGDFTLYFSTLAPRAEQLALKLLGDRFTDYQERTAQLLLTV